MNAPPPTDASGSESSPYLAEHLERFPDPPHAASHPHDDAIDPSELVRTSSAANEDPQQGQDGKADKTIETAQPSEEQVEEHLQASPGPKPMPMLGLDAELDALDTAAPVSSGSNYGPTAENEDAETGQAITVADDKPFSFASTPSSPMQVLTPPQSLSRSNSAAQSLSSSASTASLSSSSQNRSRQLRTAASQSRASAASDSKIKRRSSLLGVLGLNKNNPKKKTSLGLGASMSNISESDSASETSSLGGPSASQQLRPQDSLRRAGSASSHAPKHGPSPALSSSSTSSQITKKLTRPPHSAPPSALVTSSLKSIPPYPVNREHLQPFKQRAEFLMKFSPFGWRQLSKHGAWRPRFMLLSAIPALKTANDVPPGGHHFILSAFKTNEMTDEEVERIRLTKDTVICVTDEVGGGKLYVLKIAEAVAASGSQEPWFFSLNDVSDLTVWLRLLKSLVLQLRGVKAVDKESIPVHQDKPLPEIDDSAILQHQVAFSDIASELDADDEVQHYGEESASIQHPFASSLASHQASAADHRHYHRRNLSQDSSGSARPWGHLNEGQWVHSDDLSPELHIMRRSSASGSHSGDGQHPFGLAQSQSMRRTASSSKSFNGSIPLSTGLSAAGPLRTQAPTSPLPPLPPGARPPNPRLSVYSQSSDDTSMSHVGSSSLSSSCGKRISASSGASSFTSPGSSMASRSVHGKSTEHAIPPVPTRSPLRNAPQATPAHFATQPLPAPPPPSTPGSAAFQPTKLASHLPEHREIETASTSLFDEVTTKEDEEDAQLRAFGLTQDLPQEPSAPERRPKIRFDT